MTNNKKISDMELLPHVLAGKSQKQIASDFGVTEQTICRHVRDKSFQQSLRQYRRLVLEGTLTSLASHCQEAVDRLAILVHSKNEYVALSASKEILSKITDISLTYDIMQELEEIKENQQYLLNDADVNYR